MKVYLRLMKKKRQKLEKKTILTWMVLIPTQLRKKKLNALSFSNQYL